MTSAERRDALPLVALAAGAVAVVAVRWAPGVLDVVAAGPVRPVAVSLAVATVILACLLVGGRLVAVRRGLGDRVRVAVVPAPSFDPSEEAVVRFASGLSRSRRAVRGLLDAPASAVRVELATTADGDLAYVLELPRRARGALAAAAAAYSDIQLRDLSDELPSPVEGVGVARAELVLAGPSSSPLRAVGIDPDPLAGIAAAVGALRCDDGETATVCVDLLAVTPGQRRRLQRRLLRNAPKTRPDAAGQLGELVDLPKSGPASAGELVQRRVDRQALAAKLATPQPLFWIQLLVKTTSPTPGQAKEALAGLLAAFDVFAGDNHLRVRGLRIPGLAFLGSDLPGLRRRFDRRLASGLFSPPRRRVVSAGEIAGLLKPPTTHCPAGNVVRSIGTIPPPPGRLPTFRGQRSLLPLGRVETDRGDRLVGVPLADTFFSYMAGRSRWGKTETAIGQFLHLAKAGHGCFFLDPHEDAIRKIKAHLTDPDIRDRVVEINLANTDRQTAWNLFAPPADDAQAQRQVDAVVDAFASTLRWDETNNRALNLTTQAAQALVALARQLPPSLAPTVFQIPTLLSDPQWRAAALPLMSTPTRQFFTDRFPRLSEEAITPVTNLIDRLRAAPNVAALLGAPTASYDIRTAMDAGHIVLACPGSGSTRDRLVANFLVYDLLHAAKTRAALDPERRRPFYAFLDEVQTYDGASSGNLAALLEQTAKYGLRALLFNQNPERLTPATLNAVTTNRSHLLTTALNAKAAGLIAREWGKTVAPEVIASLERYTTIGSVTLAGEITPPFLIHGVPVEELHPDTDGPDRIDALDDAIAARTATRPVGETVAAVDGHDQRILDHLHQHRPGQTAVATRQAIPTRRP
ncbi:MAG: hypothetical protein GXY03_02565 [Solirubrobacterales bacterium]|nr:hypothetical protein [Solirubrobacterales bacterium]